MPQKRADRRRRGSYVGPLTFFLLVAALVLSPLLVSKRLVRSAGGDLLVHVSGIIEARSALAEGQFPIRIAPAANDGVRYPFFAYYGNFPYTAGGLLCCILGVNAFTAWKIVTLIALTIGGFFTFRSCELLTRRILPSLAGGAAFVMAPYMWANIHARWAYPEAVSFNLLPVVLFFSLRSFTTRRIQPVAMTGIAWSLLALSHNIAYLYASAFFGLLFVLLWALSLRRKWTVPARRLLRVGIGYALGVLLTLWYLVPQFHTLDYLQIAHQGGHPVGGDVLTTPGVLFWPVLRNPDVSNTPNLGLQVGWPLLAGVLLAAAALLRRKLLRRLRWMIAATLPLFALTLLMVAMPSQWWRFVPEVFYYVQSSYRLLMFVTLFGALLTASALAAWIRRGIRLPHLMAALAILAGFSMSYVPWHIPLGYRESKLALKKPDLGANGGKTNYLPTLAALSRTSWSHPEVNYCRPEYQLVHASGWLTATSDGRPSETFVPRSAVSPGTVLLIEGAVPREYGEPPATLSVTLEGAVLPVPPLQAGENFRVTVPLPADVLRAAQMEGDRGLHLTLRADRYPLQEGQLAFPITRLSFIPSDPPPRKFMPAGNIEPENRIGDRTRFMLETNEPALLHVPVLYYPKVLRVRSGGKDVPFGHIGPYVAVPLESGRHRVTVWYAGVEWANVASGIGWAVVGVGVVMPTVRRWRWKTRNARHRAGVKSATRPAFSASAGFASALLVGGVMFMPLGWRQVRRALSADTVTATASHTSADGFSPSAAFDGNDATEWAAPGSQPKVVLTVVPAQPGILRKVVFESRLTSLFEGWQAVRIEMFRDGKQVAAQDFSMPEAATQPIIEINPMPVLADRVEFHFSSPVTVTRDGKGRVSHTVTNPGYREIRLTWDR